MDLKKSSSLFWIWVSSLATRSEQDLTSALSDSRGTLKRKPSLRCSPCSPGRLLDDGHVVESDAVPLGLLQSRGADSRPTCTTRWSRVRPALRAFSSSIFHSELSLKAHALPAPAPWFR